MAVQSVWCAQDTPDRSPLGRSSVEGVPPFPASRPLLIELAGATTTLRLADVSGEVETRNRRVVLSS